MKQKGIHEERIVMLLVFVVLLFSFLNLSSSSASLAEQYALGDKVKLELNELGDFNIKIKTPSTTYIQKANQNLLFKPNELGEHEITVDYPSGTEVFTFEVLESLDESLENETEFATEPSLEPLLNETNETTIETNLTSNDTEIELAEYEIAEEIEVGKPVKWKRKNQSHEQLEEEYYTEAPKKSEKRLSHREKEIAVSSPENLHYEDVLVSTTIQEITSNKDLIKVYWQEEDTELPFTANDTNNNGLLDYVEWTVPHLSNQTFNVSIEILTVQSYPLIGETWEVSFATSGRANLTIRAANGTSWSNTAEDKDLKFLGLQCGPEIINYTWVEGSVFVENYECDFQGSEKSKVITEGVHTIEFTFGGQTEYAYNFARKPPAVILISNASGDVDQATPQDISWTEQERVDTNNFDHSVSVNNDQIEVLEDGIYRVNYGVYITQTGGGTDRYQVLGNIEVDDVAQGACYDSGYNRGSSSSQDLVATSECLLNLTAHQNLTVTITRTSNSDSGVNPSISTQNSWFHVQKLEDPQVLILREDVGGDAYDSLPGGLNVTFDTLVQTDPIYNFTTGGHEIQVLETGFYKVTYGVGVDSSGSRQSTFGKIQVRPGTAAWEDSPFGWSHANQRVSGGTTEAAVSASTILNLTQNDTIVLTIGRASVDDEGTQTIEINQTHLDIEYLGPRTTANLIQVYDLAGGDDLESGSPGVNDQTWDQRPHNGSDFSYTPTGSEITVNRDGLYHIAYGIYTEDHNDGSRFEWVTSLLINDVEQDVCFGAGYNRGNQGNQDNRQGAAESSCFIELSSGDTVEIRNTESSSITGTVPTAGGKVYLTVQSMDIDQLPPGVIPSSPQNITYATSSIDFNITIDEQGDTAQYSIDNGVTNFSLSSTDNLFYNATNTSMLDGSYLVYFYANDTSGNLNNTETVAFSIDTTPPEITVSSPNPTEINYSTTNVDFNITLNELGDSAWYSIDNGVTNFSLSSTDNLFYNATNTSMLDGLYTAIFFANDTVGNLNDSESRIFRVDTTPPSLTIEQPEAINYTTSTLELNYSTSDLTTNIDTCWFTIDGGVTNNTLANCQNSAFNPPQGSVTLNLYVNDTLGNVNNSESVSFFVDSISPLIAFIPPTALNGSQRADTFVFVNVSLTETNFANITFTLHNDTSLVNQTTYLTPVLEINWTNLNNNFHNYTYNVTVRDILNNVNSTETREIQLTPGDISPPDIFINSPASNLSFFNTSDVYLDLFLSEVGDTVLYSLDDGVNNYTMQTSNNINYNETNISTPDGTYTVSFFANDTTGNLGSRLRDFIVDTISPLIDYDVGTAAPNANLSQSFILANVSITEINQDLINFTLYNSGGLVNSTSFTDGTTNFTWVSVSDGDYLYNVTIFDGANNTNTTQTREIRIDTNPPAGPLISPSNNTISNQATHNLTVNATDNLGLTNITLFVHNDTALINQTQVQNFGTLALIGIEHLFPHDGDFTWYYTLGDSAENIFTTDNYTISIDTTAPIVAYTLGTLANATEVEARSIFANVSLTEANFANITYTLWNETSIANQSIFTSQMLELNWTNLPNANITYTFNVTVSDLFSNVAETTLRTIKLVDSQEPNLVLTHPEAINYTNNETIPLRYIVSDDNLAFCWYTIDDGVNNNTLSDCLNTTIALADEQEYNLTLYANDTLGQLNSTTTSFNVNTSLILTEYWLVQRGTTDVSGTQAANIDEVDSRRSLILHTARSSDSGPDAMFVKNDFLASNDQIEFENYGGATATVEWEVITGPGLAVQRGIEAFGTTDTQVNVTISNINLSAAFIALSTRLDSGTGSDTQDGRWTGRYYNNTYLILERGVSGNSGEISWQAAQFAGANVQNGSFSVSATSGTDTIPNPITLNQSFLIFSATTTSGTALDFNNIGGYISATNQVTFYRQDDDAGFMNVEWFVVESPIIRTQHSSFTASGASAIDTPLNVELINLSRSFHRSYWDSTGSGNTHANAILATALTNTTNLQTTKGTGSQTQNVSWQAIEIIEIDEPEVNLLFPGDYQNLTSLSVTSFNYSISDESEVLNCTLSGNWTGNWHENQSVASPTKDTTLAFQGLDVEESGFYIWNVECLDIYGNIGVNSTNATFGAFLFPSSPLLLDITQTTNDGTGNSVLFWNQTDDALTYEIYTTSNLSEDFVLLNTTKALNYTDTTFPGEIRRFYRIDAANPAGQNASQKTFGKHVYELAHNQNTRNWIALPTNATYLENSTNALNEITNATAVTEYNATSQRRLTCNLFSCPTFPSCTATNCNFDLEQGKGYEVNINSSAPTDVNWSLVGFVYDITNITLVKNTTDFGKNWISLYANSTLVRAQNLLENVTNSDAVSRWNPQLQTSEGLIPNPLPFGPEYLGTNFNTKIEEAYEISVTATNTWEQL